MLEYLKIFNYNFLISILNDVGKYLRKCMKNVVKIIKYLEICISLFYSFNKF